jgi:hypothetical protein
MPLTPLPGDVHRALRLLDENPEVRRGVATLARGVSRRAQDTAEVLPWCARRSWRGPAGESPVQVRGSARLVTSVASWEVTTTVKRTQ